MDKKTSKPAETVIKKSISLSAGDYEIIEDEQARIEELAPGYKISRSAIVSKALKLLKEHNAAAQAAAIDRQESGEEKIKRSAQPKGEADERTA